VFAGHTIVRLLGAGGMCEVHPDQSSWVSYRLLRTLGRLAPDHCEDDSREGVRVGIALAGSGHVRPFVIAEPAASRYRYR